MTAQPGEGAERYRSAIERRAAHHAAVREVVLSVLRERVGTGRTAAEIHACVLSRVRVGLDLVRGVLTALEREELVEVRLRHLPDGRTAHRWGRLRQDVGLEAAGGPA